MRGRPPPSLIRSDRLQQVCFNRAFPPWCICCPPLRGQRVGPRRSAATGAHPIRRRPALGRVNAARQGPAASRPTSRSAHLRVFTFTKWHPAPPPNVKNLGPEVADRPRQQRRPPQPTSPASTHQRREGRHEPWQAIAWPPVRAERSARPRRGGEARARLRRSKSERQRAACERKRAHE